MPPPWHSGSPFVTHEIAGPSTCLWTEAQPEPQRALITYEIFDAWQERLREEGRKEERKEALDRLREQMKAIYARRFGECPADIARRVDSLTEARLSDQAMLVEIAAGSKEEIRKALGRPRPRRT